jgi:hypothetical protein
MKTEKKITEYIIKIYKDDNFIGYLKNYRLIKSGYRFNKTKNLSLANKSSFKGLLFIWRDKLETKLDNFYHRGNYKFEISEITKQEVRKSKLNMLYLYKERSNILKQKIKD